MELKRNINIKFINALIVVLIVFLLYLMKDLWYGILSKILTILWPFLIGFTIAYILHPLIKKLEELKIPKTLSIISICVILLIVIGEIFWFLIPDTLPLLFDQTTSLFSSIIKFIQDLSMKYDINLISIKSSISNISNRITISFGEAISNGAMSAINQSINIISNTVIAFISAIYFMFGMENIRANVKNFLKRRKRRTFEYIKTLDKALYSYFNGLFIYMLIKMVEYTLIFYIIGHPYYLLLGVLLGIFTIIPYFGDIIINLIAIITASVISSKLMILTIIVVLIFPNIDGNFTSPKIFNKTNRMPALLTIFAVFAGGVLYGAIGIILSLPVMIIILTTCRFYQNDISNRIHVIRGRNSDS